MHSSLQESRACCGHCCGWVEDARRPRCQVMGIWGVTATEASILQSSLLPWWVRRRWHSTRCWNLRGRAKFAVVVTVGMLEIARVRDTSFPLLLLSQVRNAVLPPSHRMPWLFFCLLITSEQHRHTNCKPLEYYSFILPLSYLPQRCKADSLSFGSGTPQKECLWAQDEDTCAWGKQSEDWEDEE